MKTSKKSLRNIYIYIFIFIFFYIRMHYDARMG